MTKTDEEPDFPPEPPPEPVDPNSPAERFYSGAIDRILRSTIVFSIVCTAAAFSVQGPRAAVGLLAGAALAWWNFRSLARTVNSLGERIVVAQSQERGGAIVFRFVSRILLVGLAGYAIFVSSLGSLRGFLVGLCMPVPALLWEAAYEGFTALRRGL